MKQASLLARLEQDATIGASGCQAPAAIQEGVLEVARPNFSILWSTKTGFLSIVAKQAELAETGNTSMIAAVLKLKVPAPRDSGVLMPLELSPLETPAHAVAALRLIAQAVARGDIDPDAARGLTAAVGAFLEAVKVADLDQKLKRIEEQVKK